MNAKKNNNLIFPLVLNLNTHSFYSLLNSTLSIDNIINFAISQNQKYVALTDNNMYGVMEFYLKCKNHNLIPIVGLTIDNTNLIYTNFTKPYYFIIIAKNNNGYKNLIKISSNLLTSNQFELTDYLKDVFVIDLNNNFDFKSNIKIYNIDKKGENAIALNTANYLNDDYKVSYNALNAIKNNLIVNETDLLNGIDYPLLTLEQTLSKFNQVQIKNLNEEIKDINLEIGFDKNNMITFTNNDKNISNQTLLRQWTLKGLDQKIFEKQINSELKNEYLNRIEHELNIINQMGFNDYFLVVADFVNEARNKKILIGPGRGSAAGSLVAYLLNITQIDSIKYNLLFERFLNPGRISMPDIDIDIMDTRRNEVVDYLIDKYGINHVAHIVTFQRIKAKNAIRDVGRILNIDLKEINLICKSIPFEYDENLSLIINDKNLNHFYYRYQTLFDIAIKIINCPRQTGMHAAGIVLSQKPLYEVVPIQNGANGEITTQYDMDYLEKLGLIKMDLLGLTNLSTISQVIELINLNYGINIDLNNLNLDDQNVFLDATNGYTLGIFQLESPGMTKVVKRMKPKCIEDISLCSALYRPGPKQNIDLLINRRNNEVPIEFIDHKNKAILATTYGILVYQEQVINLVTSIANFSLSQADLFRRIIGKKQTEELVNFKKLFYESALKNGYEKNELDKIYNFIETFAGYGFNHSHSVSYALISYWLLYLKHYYPLEFMAILMKSSEHDKSKIHAYVLECLRLNINVLKPNLNHSSKSFTLYKKHQNILFGLCSIKGIGVETASKIIKIRNELKDQKFKDYLHAIEVLTNNKIGKSVIETLIYGGAFDCFNINKQHLLVNLDLMIDFAKNTSGLLDMTFNINNKLQVIDQVDQITQKELNQIETNLLGFDLQNILDKKTNNKYKATPNNQIIETETTIIATISKIETKKTRANKNYLNLTLIDENNNIYTVGVFNNYLIQKILLVGTNKKISATITQNGKWLNLTELNEV